MRCTTRKNNPTVKDRRGRRRTQVRTLKGGTDNRTWVMKPSSKAGKQQQEVKLENIGGDKTV